MRPQRWRLRAAVTGATVVALVAATGPNGTAAPSGGGPSTAGPKATPAGVQAGETALPATDQLSADGTKVTLITGDTVSYTPGANGAEPQAEVTSPRNASFTKVRDGDHFYVYPGDARALVGAGKLDKMLFDVAYLAENGYADDAAKSLPVIVQYPKTAATSRSPGSTGSAASAAADAKVLSTKADALPATSKVTGLSVVNAAAVQVAKADTTTFWSSVDAPKPGSTSLDAGVAKIWLDRKVTASLDVSVPQIGAPEAWAAGYDGTGIKVAVLDTGIDDTHPDFAGKIAESRSFVDGGTTKDGFGHGTHVASTIVGSGAASDGKYKGVAPGAELIVGKVLDDNGNGTESQIIAGMTWAAQSDARIVSMSLGGCCSDGTDPMAQAVDDLTAQYGTLFVIAAGNNGATSTINSPGAADAALTVAAVDKQDQMASFSSRGPRSNNLGLKPDIAAPGVNIVAARAEGTTMPGAVHVGDRYTTVSGTSMATPHVAGSAAILAQEHPDWSGQKLKQVLTATSKDLGHGTYDMGAGRVDVARATTQQVYATGSVAFGRVPFPHTAPASKPLTYVNDGDTPVTLDLTATGAAVTPGVTVPEGLFTVNPSTVTVPAHGTADVDVLFDVTKNVPNTVYGGHVRAVSTDGSVVVNTAVGGQKQARQVKVTLTIVNRPDMADIVYFGYSLLRLDDKPGEVFNAFSGPLQTVTGTVDAGIYSIGNDVTWRDKDGEWNRAIFNNPNVDATGDKDVTVTFDLRKAVLETVRTPKSSVSFWQTLGYRHKSEGAGVWLTQEYRLPHGATKIWSLPSGKAVRGTYTGYSIFYNGVQPVTMSIAGRGRDRVALHPQYQAVLRTQISPRRDVTMLDGRSQLGLVAAGHGLPADFASVDARGKIVLLDLSDICRDTPVGQTSRACESDGLDRVQNAKDAGAVAVLGYGAVGRQFLLPLNEISIYGIWATYPIPTMGLTADEGRLLAARLAKAPVTLDVDATRVSPYLYPLAWITHDRLPVGPKTVADRDLHRFDERVHTDAPGTLGALSYAPIIGGNTYANYSMLLPAPFTSTAYVGPLGQAAAWRTVSGGSNFSESRAGMITRAGSEVRDWGEQPLVPSVYHSDPATAPYLSQYCFSCRSGDILSTQHVITHDGTAQGSIAYGTAADGSPVNVQRLYRADGTEIPMKEGFWLFFIAGFWSPYFELPAGQETYRMTEDFTSPLVGQKYSREVRTERRFTSQHSDDGMRPDTDGLTGIDCSGWLLLVPEDGKFKRLDDSPCNPSNELYLGYDFDLALDNTLPAGSRQDVTVTGFGSPYLAAQPKLTSLKLSLSYDDGKTWQQVKTKAKKDGTFTGEYDIPALSRTTGAVTIRAEATDTHGNTVKQTIDRAFGITAATGATLLNAN